jgi:DNA-binding FadR family transcriptional regulator
MLHLFRARCLVEGGGLAISNSEHREMVEAIEARDPDRAQEAHFNHVMRSRERLSQTEHAETGAHQQKVPK